MNFTIDAIRPKTKKKQWLAKERYELVANVIAGKSAKQVACENGLEPSKLHKWVKQYKLFGNDGFINKPIGASKEKSNNGERILLKSGSNPYQQEPFNEVLASEICKRLEIPFVEYPQNL